MPITVAAAVLFSAVLHASWNAVIRFRGDRIGMITLLAGFGGLLALPGAIYTGPPPPASWSWLATSVVLHLGYNVFLALAYSHGELGKVYPLARGTAPLLTLLASFFLVGEALGGSTIAGIVTLGVGIIALTFDRGIRVVMDAPRGVAFALATSLFVAGYTLSDGLGARAAGDPHSYTLWLFVLDGFPLLAWALIARGRRTVEMIAENWKAGLLVSVLSLGAYWIVIWAMTVAPIPLVAALRETSVVIAVIIGVAFLGERLTFGRILSVGVVMAGLALLRL